MTQREQNHNEHWRNTVQTLNLRGIILAGMAVFIVYFSVRQSSRPLPTYFLINPFMSAAVFSVVVCRIHLTGTLEDEMAAWWDRTIDHATWTSRYFDYALEGPWLSLLIALPFSSISPVTFGFAYGLWSLLELAYMDIGKRALDASPQASLGSELTFLVRRYYRVRVEQEALATLLGLAVGVLAVLLAYNHGNLILTCALWAAIVGLFLNVNFLEVARNPWFEKDLTHVADVPATPGLAATSGDEVH